jgi:hypothetical protein
MLMAGPAGPRSSRPCPNPIPALLLTAYAEGVRVSYDSPWKRSHGGVSMNEIIRRLRGTSFKSALPGLANRKSYLQWSGERR